MTDNYRELIEEADDLRGMTDGAIQVLVGDLRAALESLLAERDALAAQIAAAREYVYDVKPGAEDLPVTRSEVQRILSADPDQLLREHDAKVWDEVLDAIEQNELNTQQAREGNPYLKDDDE